MLNRDLEKSHLVVDYIKYDWLSSA